MWRSFMGWRATLCIFGVFFVVMVASALAMEELFKGLGLGALPSRNGVSARLLHVSGSVNFTLVMTVVFVAMTAWLYVVKRRGDPRHAEAGHG